MQRFFVWLAQQLIFFSIFCVSYFRALKWLSKSLSGIAFGIVFTDTATEVARPGRDFQAERAGRCCNRLKITMPYFSFPISTQSCTQWHGNALKHATHFAHFGTKLEPKVRGVCFPRTFQRAIFADQFSKSISHACTHMCTHARAYVRVLACVFFAKINTYLHFHIFLYQIIWSRAPCPRTSSRRWCRWATPPSGASSSWSWTSPYRR